MGQAARQRHARHFAFDAEENFAIWRSLDQPVAYAWLDREIGNLSAAFRWARDHGEADMAIRIAASIGNMARFRLREDASTWAAEVIEPARRARHRRLPALLTWAATSAWSFGRLAQARRWAEEAISLAGKPGFDPFVLPSRPRRGAAASRHAITTGPIATAHMCGQRVH